MSASAPLFSKLLDTLKAAGPALSIPVATERVFQMQADANGEKPYIVVHLPVNTPFMDSKFVGTSQMMDTHYTALVSVAVEVPRGVAHLLGDNTTPGPLNLFEDIANAIENGRSGFLGATTQFVDMTITGNLVYKESEALMTGTLTIDFWTRTAAGSR